MCVCTSSDKGTSKGWEGCGTGGSPRSKPACQRARKQANTVLRHNKSRKQDQITECFLFLFSFANHPHPLSATYYPFSASEALSPLLCSLGPIPAFKKQCGHPAKINRCGFFTCSRDSVGDVHKQGVLVIHIIMGRGPPKGVKDSRRRTVNSTQKSKHNQGGNGGTAAANGERSTTALSKMSKESAVCCHAQHCIKKM